MKTHQQDIHTIIYLEQIIYASDRMLMESELLSSTDGTPSKADRLRVLSSYDQSNTDPHHQHWHRERLGGDMVVITKPAPFNPF
jgi:hypothetical protein